MSDESARHVALLTLVLLVVTTTACIWSSPLTEKSPLTVLGTLADADQVEIVEARIILTRGKHVVETTVPVSQNEFQGTIQVPVGEWELTVLLVDAEGIVHYQSQPQDTQISLAEPTLIELVLHPADSIVQIQINLENYIFKNEAMRARIHFDDTVHEVIRPDLETPLDASISVSPGSYEFKIELYTESFRIGDRLGLGKWELLHIDGNEEVFISWSPETSDLQVSGRVEIILPPPDNLLLSSDATGVNVSWDPVVHPQVTGYFLFAKDSHLERFELLNPIPLDKSSFIHELDPDNLPTEITYVAAAVSTSGFVGYYSAPQIWRP